MTASKGKKHMSEQAIAANQQNAQKSTGPKTPEGKEKSKYNAFKFGLYCSDPLIPGESREEYQAFHESMFHTLGPQNPLQWFYFDQITSQMWTLQRLVGTEANIEVYAAFQEDHTGQLDKVTKIQLRKLNVLNKLLTQLRATRDRGFIASQLDALLTLAQAPRVEAPETDSPQEEAYQVLTQILPSDPESAVMEVDYVVDGITVAPGRFLKNPHDFKTSGFAKQVDHMLGLLEMPNPTVFDIVRTRLRNLPRNITPQGPQANAS